MHARARTHDFVRKVICLATFQIYQIESAFQRQHSPDDIICIAKFKKTLSTDSSFSAKFKQWGRKCKSKFKGQIECAKGFPITRVQAWPQVVLVNPVPVYFPE